VDCFGDFRIREIQVARTVASAGQRKNCTDAKAENSDSSTESQCWHNVKIFSTTKDTIASPIVAEIRPYHS
jgi:hypothetical protein